MSKLVDLTEQRFGRLTVIAKEGSREYRPGKYRIYWRCKCDCGNECSAHTTDLRTGKVKSCGCLKRSVLGESSKKENLYRIGGSCVYVKLSNAEKEMIVDIGEWEKWAKFCCWHLNANGYAATHIDGRNKLFHWVIFPEKESGVVVDHINGNRLDNRMENLRLVNRAQNNMNKGLRSDNTSGHTGVSWDKSKGKWVVQIQIDGKNKHIGRYASKKDAINARIKAEEKYFGEYRRKG